MSDTRHSVTITSITCKGTSESGNDEVFILYQVDGGLPVRYPAEKYQRMNPKADPSNNVLSTWGLNLDLNFDHEVLVTLWDNDSTTNWNEPDFLVNIEYRADYFTSSYEMKNDNGADYVINATKIK